MERSPYYPFPPRPGAGPALPETVPEATKLSPEDEQAVLQFEHDLYDAKIGGTEFAQTQQYLDAQTELGKPVEPLITIWKRKLNSSELAVSYFETDEGRALLHEQTGVELPTETDRPMAALLSDLDTSEWSSTSLNKLSAASVGYEETTLTESFVAAGYDSTQLPSPTFVTLYKNPEVLVAKAQGYRQFKQYLSQVKADLELQVPESESAQAAKLFLVDAYRRRVNRMLSETYVSAFGVLAQYRTSGETNHAETIAGLASILPAFESDIDGSQAARFLQRLDRYKHGVSHDGQSEDYSWLSQQAERLALAAGQTSEPQPVDRDVYADIDPELLHTTQIDGQQFAGLLKNILGQFGLLSEDIEWDSERPGRAHDQKWQVVVDDKFKSLMVSSKHGVMQVPSKPRSLFSAITVGNHELTHVLQHEYKQAISQLAILREIGLDTASEQVEAGGIWQENVAANALNGFATQKTNGMGYYQALAVKARGGSYGECVQAYYDAMRVSRPSEKPEKLAAESVNRARRLFRAGGFEYAQDTQYLTNTQPLSYLEQRLLYEELTEKQRKYLLVGGVTVANLFELNKHGLVDAKAFEAPKKMPWQMMHDDVKALLQAEN